MLINSKGHIVKMKKKTSFKPNDVLYDKDGEPFVVDSSGKKIDVKKDQFGSFVVDSNGEKVYINDVSENVNLIYILILDQII